MEKTPRCAESCLSDAYLIAGCDRDLGHLRIDRPQAAAAIDDDEIAISGQAVEADDASRAGSEYVRWTTVTGSKVHTSVDIARAARLAETIEDGGTTA